MLNNGTADGLDRQPQLPMADLAKATQPSLWDGVDLEAFGVDRAATIGNYRPAERMLTALGLDVSLSAKVIAAALAYHGWVSWPGLDRLVAITRIAKPNVSLAAKELEDAGVIRKSRHYHPKGQVGIQYAFSGAAIAQVLEFRDYHIDNGGSSAIITLITKPEFLFLQPEKNNKEGDSNGGTGDLICSSEEKGRGTNSPPPPPEPITQPPRPIYHPDAPPPDFMAGYCQTMLRRYATTWLASWKKEIDEVIRYYATRWPKFLKDLQRHRANELGNRPYGAGLETADVMEPEAEIDSVECLKCQRMTTRPKKPMSYRGRRVTDGCAECEPLPAQRPLKELIRQE